MLYIFIPLEISQISLPFYSECSTKHKNNAENRKGPATIGSYKTYILVCWSHPHTRLREPHAQFARSLLVFCRSSIRNVNLKTATE